MNPFDLSTACTFNHNGIHEILPFTGVWVDKNCKDQCPGEGWRQCKKVAHNTESENGFKSVATLYSKPGKQIHTREQMKTNIPPNETKATKVNKIKPMEVLSWSPTRRTRKHNSNTSGTKNTRPNPTKQAPDKLKKPNVSMGTSKWTSTGQNSLGW